MAKTERSAWEAVQDIRSSESTAQLDGGADWEFTILGVIDELGNALGTCYGCPHFVKGGYIDKKMVASGG
jgi:hypothetical protein